MRRHLILPLVLTAAVAAAAQQSLQPVDETKYKSVLLGRKGNVVLVSFWATWCSPCLEEMPHLVKLEAKYRARGFRLVTISCDEPEQEADAYRFLEKHRVPAPRYIKKAQEDEKFIDFVNPKWSGALPAVFLYGRDGRLAGSFIGETDLAALEKAIFKAL